MSTTFGARVFGEGGRPTHAGLLTQRAQNVARTTSITTAVTTITVTALAKLETNHPAAALNATSHIVWGERRTGHNAADLRHTLLGGALNAAAMGMWASVNEMLPRARSGWGALFKGAALSCAAYVADYYLVPKRLTPGFEKRLSRTALLITFAAFAGALAVSEAAAMRAQFPRRG